MLNEHQFGCGILKMVGPNKQDFGQKSIYLKETIVLRGAPVCQKLSMVLQNKVRKKWSPKLKFLNDFFFEKNLSIFEIEY